NDDMIFDVYDRNFQKLQFKRKGLRNSDIPFSKPVNYKEMVKIAETLSVDFPHVRVDLYNIAGSIFFGELTFYHASGYIEFEIDEFDYILGDEFFLPKEV